MFFDNYLGMGDCSVEPEQNLFVDPRYCDEQDGTLTPSRLSWESEAFATNNSFGVDIGWQGEGPCAWGTLSRDVTTGSEDVRVLTDVTVPAGLSLTLLPGATLRFDEVDESGGGNYSGEDELLIEGSLNADATGQSPILFTSAAATPAAGDWGVVMIGGSASVDLRNALLEYSSDGMVYVSETSTNVIDGCTFRHNLYSDMYINKFIGTAGPAGTISNCTFEVDDCPYGVKMYFTTQTLSIANCVFNGTSQALAGLFLWNYSPSVSGGSIQGFSQGSGILVRNNASPTVQNVDISGNQVGLEWKNAAGGVIDGCTLSPGTSQPTDIWVYENAHPTIKTCSFDGPAGSTGIRVDDGGYPDIGPDNTFERKFGVSVDDTASPEIHGNTFTGGSNAIVATFASTPRIRSNVITGSYKAILSESTAQPDVGTVADPGNNSITNSQVKHIDGGNARLYPLMAELNWWGGTPAPGKFTAGVDYDPWLTEEPLGPAAFSVALVESNGALAPGAFPNPMQANVRLLFRNEGGNPGSAGIFDVEGRLVRQLSLQRVTDGLVGAEWDGLDSSGRRVPSGVYFYRYGTSKEGRGRLVVAR
jgi:hypothetical protein